MKIHAQLWISYLIDKFWSKVNHLMSFGKRFGVLHIFLRNNDPQHVQINDEVFMTWQEINTICVFKNGLLCINLSYQLIIGLFKIVTCYMPDTDINSPFSC